jgi:hypothetical protein
METKEFLEAFRYAPLLSFCELCAENAVSFRVSGESMVTELVYTKKGGCKMHLEDVGFGSANALESLNKLLKGMSGV